MRKYSYEIKFWTIFALLGGLALHLAAGNTERAVPTVELSVVPIGVVEEVVPSATTTSLLTAAPVGTTSTTSTTPVRVRPPAATKATVEEQVVANYGTLPQPDPKPDYDWTPTGYRDNLGYCYVTYKGEEQPGWTADAWCLETAP